MKCEKCNNAEATVFYSVISGKFKATRKNYCRSCMESERVRLSVPKSPTPSVKAQGASSLLDIVRGEINKQGQIAKGEQSNKVEKSDPSLKGIKKLEQKMKDAIREEKYEEAAKIRDEIAALNKSGKEPG